MSYLKIQLLIGMLVLGNLPILKNSGHLPIPAMKLSVNGLSVNNLESNILDKEFSSLDEIFLEFNGKVIYVDFWASWCKPCIDAFPASKKLQSRFDSAEVVFLFLGYKDQKDSWTDKIRELDPGGWHVRLSGPLISEAHRKFGIQAIPHYAIIDKDGNIYQSMSLSPDYKEVMDDLVEAVKK